MPEQFSSVQTATKEISSFQQLLDNYEYDLPKKGDFTEATILSKDSDEILVDIGGKHDAVVPRKDIERLDDSILSALKVGDSVDVRVLRTPGPFSSRLLVSISQALSKQDWDEVLELQAENRSAEIAISDVNRGGLVGLLGSLRGFIPNSCIPGYRAGLKGDQLISFKRNFVGEQMRVKVLEADRRQQRLVLSAREDEKENIRRILEQYSEGDRARGTVVQIMPYGAFIDLGGVHGLLHISEMAWHDVKNPEDEVSVGEQIDVEICRIEPERARIGLSRKALEPGPWDTIDEKFNPGDLCEGEIVAVKEFGLFVRLQPGLDGLVHKTEMDGTVIPGKPIFKTGDRVLVRVIGVDSERQRIGLSMKQVTYQEEVDWMQERNQDNPEGESDLHIEADSQDVDQGESDLHIEADSQ
ncbi:MAG: S1 RNA-binding domain-containing protein, partial [Anaerolineales bacterium]|nr:S1 RNA-binding domain-containing protein [Anaerolineales bacterium]